MRALIPAATVIPLRDVPRDDVADDEGATALEVLMLRKNSQLAFGGMWVFPGGRIDPGDEDPDRPGDELATAARAAAREALEEADLLVEPAAMVPFSHWTPPPSMGDLSLRAPKRFSTWFFACRAPVGEAGEVTIDHGEIHEDVWVRPAEMLRRRDAGDIQLVPPTVVTLHELAAHDDVDSVLAAASAREPLRYATKILGLSDDAADGMVALWEGDAAYDTEDLSLPGPRHRLVMVEPEWRLEVDR